MEAEGEALAEDVERDGGRVRGSHGRDAVEQRVPRVGVRARARLRLRLRLRLRAEG